MCKIVKLWYYKTSGERKTKVASNLNFAWNIIGDMGSYRHKHEMTPKGVDNPGGHVSKLSIGRYDI